MFVIKKRTSGLLVNLIVYFYETFQIIPLNLNLTVEDNIKIAIQHLGNMIPSTPGKRLFKGISEVA